jgi:exonuclease VII large subunit
MTELFELKRQLVLGQESLDRTKEQLEQLQQELEQEHQKRVADEERDRFSKLESQILEKISEICLPGAEQHLLTLLKSGGFLEIDGDRISVKSTDRYGLPAIVSLEAGLPELIRQQFPHFIGSQEENAPKNSPDSGVEKLEAMSDRELLSLMTKPEEMIKIVNSF